MITEFTCGIFKAEKGQLCWSVFILNKLVAIIDHEGETVEFNSELPPTTQSSLIELAALMNNIKRQYKQLQTP